MKKKIKINKLCKRCANSCKQPAFVILVSCPNFEYLPQQLEISFAKPRENKK